QTFLLPILQFSAIPSPFTFGKRGDSGRTAPKITQTFLLPILQFSAIPSPFTFGKRGDSGRTAPKITQTFLLPILQFRPFLPRLPSENGSTQAAQREKSVETRKTTGPPHGLASSGKTSSCPRRRNDR
ncbi:MAG: hypothetical protein PHQ75_03910, partial [Thermoguttaceae bacterium]|nr:hypothetical protein [Thermoguttaceae bacterium]